MHRTPNMLSALLVGLACASAQAQTEDLGDGLYAVFSTSKGTIVAELYPEKAPMTVNNFVALAEGTMSKATRKGPFYDGLSFHRVIAGFMIQGGCPDGNGRGGPGYAFADEVDTGLKHDGPGILSMANAGPATNGSQFFITHDATPHLDGKHTVFGKVVVGQKVVMAIRKGDTIKTLKIVRKGQAATAFTDNEKAFDALVAKWKAAQKKKLEGRLGPLIKKIKARFPEAQGTESGLFYVVTREGQGPTPTKGQTVTAHYIGRLFSNDKVFDSSVKRGQPFEFPVGMRRVIPGWDEAFISMKRGEKRTLIIPAHLAYGARGAGAGVIPPNATLVFEVELIDFR